MCICMYCPRTCARGFAQGAHSRASVVVLASAFRLAEAAYGRFSKVGLDVGSEALDLKFCGLKL